MTRISIFDTSVQCEEYFSGYAEWSEELEESLEGYDLAAQAKQCEEDARMERENTRKTEAGAILIKRQCTHSGCGFHCGQAFRIGGFDL
jgi:hypothetical protein